MYITNSIRVFYLTYFLLVCLFFAWFIVKVRKPGVSVIEEKASGMDKREKRFFMVLIAGVVLGHVVTLSNIVPWQKWRLWSVPKVAGSYNIEISDYTFKFPEEPITFQRSKFVEFNLTSTDVTYGFGVFRKDGTLVFQMQVLPSYENRFVWNFSEPGYYDVRSTEYSGPKHSEMVVRNAIHVQ